MWTDRQSQYKKQPCQYTLLQLSWAGRRVGPVLFSLQPLCVRHLEYRATVQCRTTLHGTVLIVRKLCENADIVYGDAVSSSTFLFASMALNCREIRRQCKMSSSKKLPCKGTLRQVFICIGGPEPHTPIPPPPLKTVYVYSVYSTLIHTGKGGELNQRES
jgi:hypothetical protein